MSPTESLGMNGSEPTNHKPAQLSPSELGTKAYWDALYTREISNYEANPEDEGTIWFDDSNAEDKMIETLEDLDFGADGNTDKEINVANPNLRILDVGTGNGHFLFALRDAGWQGCLIGVDYSEVSVSFAQKVQMARWQEISDQSSNDEHDEEGRERRQRLEIGFEHWDILSENRPEELFHKHFDIVVDKGTFDAVSLQGETTDQSSDRTTATETYVQRVQDLLGRGGYFVIVSCNWTETELRSWFEQEDLHYYKSVKFPRFKFGGVEGQSVSGLCFKKS